MRKALVIGATGGIGSAICAELEKRGTMVTAVSRSTHGLDLTDAASVDDVLWQIKDQFDLVVCATGILTSSASGPEKSLSAIDAHEMSNVMAVNAVGVALIMRHIPALLPKTGRAVAAFLTARVGSIGDNRLGGWYSYRASKAAANQIIRTAAIEIGRARKDAVVVALHPGTVATAFTADYAGHSKVTPEECASNLLGVIENLSPGHSGGFYDWAGAEVAW